MASPSEPVPDPLAEALRENHELMQHFLYAASHDLQEPLRGIITYAQLLDRQLAGDPAAHEYTSFILDGALRMRELLQQFLVYSRAGSPKQRKVVNLNVPLQMALLKLSSEIRSSNAHVERDHLPNAIGDETEFAQVFEHILSNSLKFRSAAAPEIVVSAEQGIAECTITLRDNGLGIDPPFCEQVFLPFKRLHGKSIPGSGLGLAICSKIVRAHKGRIWAESDGRTGTTVRFTLPT